MTDEATSDDGERLDDGARRGDGERRDDAVVRDPETFYDDYGHEEWERLERSLHGRLEWGTVEYLERHLPESGHVLDAGGAAGRYTVWLAEQGYDVTLVDLSAEQLAIAREKVTKRGLGSRVTIQEGDIRELQFDDDAFDATLCLGGPLSHVLDESERERAVRELRRVSAPGAPVFVSVMGLLGFLQLMVAAQKKLDALPELAETGDYGPDLLEKYGYDSDFVSTHFFRVDGFEALLEREGLAVERLAGLEGVASGYAEESLRETTDDLSRGQQESIRTLVGRQREGRTVVDMSAHMLAVCTAAGRS